MKILLFGISNVGKTTIGTMLAKQLGYSFYDLDEEVKKEFKMTLEEFVHTENLRWRDQKRGRIIKKILAQKENMVFVISPISYTDNFGKRITEDDILSIELVDTPANIFDRLVFSDIDDTIYKDDDYKNQRRDYYMSDIKADLEWYGNVYSKIGVKNRFEINNDSPKTAVKRLIKEYGLSVVLQIRCTSSMQIRCT